MTFPRSAGVLLHPTSLPSRGGIGDLGPAAYRFIDFLHDAKQSLRQILPLNPTGLGNSPYSAISAFAGNPLLISLEELERWGWLTEKAAAVADAPPGPIDYERVNRIKLPLLRKAAQGFLTSPRNDRHAAFDAFCSANAWWLNDFALFNCLRERYRNESWNKWPRPLAARETQAMHDAGVEMFAELQVERALQFAFWEQWKSLHGYCREKGIKIIGDVAIFVNYDSTDVWCHPENFFLDAELAPTVVSGVPPDAFSKTGQRWGNPLYRWEALKSRGYDWWIQRMRWATTACDYVRLDHFRGFEQFWEIPAQEPTAINGKWVDGPKDSLFQALRSALGDLPFIAEDLGMITPEVEALRRRANMPGMKVLQFAFSDKGAHIYLPHNYTDSCVAYTGTHDNDTSAGWWESLDKDTREQCTAYLGESKDGVHWAMVRSVMASPAAFAVVPAQDLLGLGSDARMNTPSRSDGNWGWRLSPEALSPQVAKKL